MFKMLGVENAYLQNILNICVGSNFHGVYSIDMIPFISQTEGKHSIVCNLAESTVQFGHFVSICISNKCIYFYDPTGSKPNKTMNKYLKKYNKTIKLNTVKHQSLLSSFCSFFVIANVLKYHFPKKVRLNYKTKLLKNDDISVKIICDFISKYLFNKHEH